MKKFRYTAFLVCFTILMASHIPTSSAYNISGTYINTNNQTVSYSKYDGQYLFVEAMWSDCPHCQDMASTLDQLHTDMGSQITMLSIGIWPTTKGETIDALKNFANKYKVSWDMGMDHPDEPFSNHYNIRGTPTMILFGPNGDELVRWSGETTLTKLKSDINYVLTNKITDTSKTTLPTTLGTGQQNVSVIEQIFSSPLFQALAIVILLLVIYTKMTGGGASKPVA